MTTLSSDIDRLIAAANALGAPLFSLDRFHAVAKLLEEERMAIVARHEAGAIDGEGLFAVFLPPTEDVDVEIAIVADAVRAAWAFIASRYLPESIAAPMQGDLAEGVGKAINDAVIAGLDVVTHRIGRIGS